MSKIIFSKDAEFGSATVTNQLTVSNLTVEGKIDSQYVKDLQEQAQYTEDMAHINRVRLNHEATQTDILEEGRAYDYIICGSGSGGGMAALTLALEGPWFNKDVLVIDKGHYRAANMYHEYPAVNSANYYYGKHNWENIIYDNLEDKPVILWAFEREKRYDDTWIPGRKSIWSPSIFGGGSTINGGLLNAVPDFKLRDKMPKINITLFRECGTWIHRRMGINTNSYKIKTHSILNDIAERSYGSSIRQAYAKDAQGNYTVQAKAFQKEYMIESWDLAAENDTAYSFPENGGRRSVALITAVTTALYRKRHGIAYQLETYQGKNLHILIKHNVDRLLWDKSTLPVSPVDVSGNNALSMRAIGVEVTDLTISRKDSPIDYIDNSGNVTSIGLRRSTYPILLKPGGEVFLAGNVYGSPLIAMRSGYGPQAELAKLALADPAGARFKAVAYNEEVGKNFISPCIVRELTGGYPLMFFTPWNLNRTAEGITNNQSPYDNEFQTLPNAGTLDLGLFFYSNQEHQHTTKYTNGSTRLDVSSSKFMSYMIQTAYLGLNTNFDYGTTDTLTSCDFATEYKYFDVSGSTEDANNFLQFAMDNFYKNKKRGALNQANIPSDGLKLFSDKGITLAGVGNIECNSLSMGGYVKLFDAPNSGKNADWDLYTPKASLQWFNNKDNLVAIKESVKHVSKTWCESNTNDVTDQVPMMIPANTTDPYEQFFCVIFKGVFFRYVHKNIWRTYAKPPLIDPLTKKPYLTPSGVFVQREMTWEELLVDEPEWLGAHDASGRALTVADVNGASGFVKYDLSSNARIYYQTTDGSYDYDPVFFGGSGAATYRPPYYKYENTANDIYGTSRTFTPNQIVWRVVKTDASGFKYVDLNPSPSDKIETQFDFKRNIDNSIKRDINGQPEPLINNSAFDNHVIYQSLDSIHFSGSMFGAIDQSSFKLKGVNNVRVADSSVIGFPQLANSQGMCMQLGRYIALQSLGDIPEEIAAPNITTDPSAVWLFGPNGSDADLSNNFVKVGGGTTQGIRYYHNFDVSGSEGSRFIRSPCNETVNGNTFLASRQNYTNFILSVEYKAERGFKNVNGVSKQFSVNSGVLMRSEQLASGVAAGFQAEIHDGPQDGNFSENTGIYYEGDGGIRGFVSRVLNGNKSVSAFRTEDWNQMVIKCQGANYKIWLNGVLCTDFTEVQRNFDYGYTRSSGFVALQNHQTIQSDPTLWNGEGSAINFRNVRIKTL